MVCGSLVCPLTLDKQLIKLVYNQTSWSHIPDDLALGARLAGPCFNFEVFGGQARRTDGYLPTPFSIN